jgi:hypothetical protein
VPVARRLADEESDHHMHVCRTLAALAVGGVLALAGCSGGGSSGSGSGNTGQSRDTSGGAAGGSTTTTVDVAAKYQAVVRKAEQATCTFNKGVAALGPHPLVRETKNLVPPVTAALRRFRRELGDIPWPANAQRDATSLQQATDGVVADIEALPDQSPASMSAWTAKTQKDKALYADATRSLRAHIGLLPLAAETCA